MGAARSSQCPLRQIGAVRQSLTPHDVPSMTGAKPHPEVASHTDASQGFAEEGQTRAS